MPETRPLFSRSLTLLTDLYQLTMGYGYFKSGKASETGVFNLFFRKNPYQGGYAVAAGLDSVIRFIKDFRFSEGDLAYLGEILGNDGKPLFDADYLAYLAKLEFGCDVDAVPEGTIVFPHEPMLRIRGPIVECQILETALLNMLNFQTLIATKASRVCQAAGDDLVMEFGLRRAQGIDGALTASRAAYIGGCGATSNVLAGKLYEIPVKGTHAHSWVMSFDDELAAFEAYARAMPNNCVFLVDTYGTIEGVKKAIAVSKALRARGYEPVGVRLDSGDLCALSIAARKLLDEAGFPEAAIVASNDLDEYAILDLKAKGAKIDVWGVGTRLVTSYDQPALGGVYKIAALREEGAADWKYKIKVSEEKVKVSNPGILQVVRYVKDGKLLEDVLVDEANADRIAGAVLIDGGASGAPAERKIDPAAKAEKLLQPIFRAGKYVYREPTIHAIRDRVRAQIAMLPEGVRALAPPKGAAYPVSLEKSLSELKDRIIENVRAGGAEY